MNLWRTDYRGVVAHLADYPALVETLGLAKIPHFTTLEKAAKRRLKSAVARRLLEATIAMEMDADFKTAQLAVLNVR